MNIEIKFRQLITTTRIIGFNERSGNRVNLNTESGGKQWHYWGFIGGAFVAPQNNNDKSDQFTGLLDKQGKEIYFGDILSTHNDGYDGADKWGEHEHGYTVVRESSPEIGINYQGWSVEYTNDGSVYHTDYIEVIGNIYENKELLK